MLKNIEGQEVPEKKQKSGNIPGADCQMLLLYLLLEYVKNSPKRNYILWILMIYKREELKIRKNDVASKLTFTCLKLTIETLEKAMKYVQS